MKATMKKRLVKGILAATLAFVTVVGIPVGAAKTATSDNTIIAYAACSHNYRHYGTWSNWYVTNNSCNKMFNEVHGGYAYAVTYNCRIMVRSYWPTCVNCGYMDAAHPLKTEYGYIKGYKVSEKLLGHA